MQHSITHSAHSAGPTTVLQARVQASWNSFFTPRSTQTQPFTCFLLLFLWISLHLMVSTLCVYISMVVCEYLATIDFSLFRRRPRRGPLESPLCHIFYVARTELRSSLNRTPPTLSSRAQACARNTNIGVRSILHREQRKRVVLEGK